MGHNQIIQQITIYIAVAQGLGIAKSITYSESISAFSLISWGSLSTLAIAAPGDQHAGGVSKCRLWRLPKCHFPFIAFHTPFPHRYSAVHACTRLPNHLGSMLGKDKLSVSDVGSRGPNWEGEDKGFPLFEVDKSGRALL